jgi:hypothetical protein
MEVKDSFVFFISKEINWLLIILFFALFLFFVSFVLLGIFKLVTVTISLG